MNSRAQVLVIFVILLPLLMLFSMYVVDTTVINYNKNRLDNIGESILDILLDEEDFDKAKIEDLVKKNDKDIVVKDVKLNDSVKITLEKEIPSIFGKFIGKDKYLIKSILNKNKNG